MAEGNTEIAYVKRDMEMISTQHINPAFVNDEEERPYEPVGRAPM